jgi:Endonuclease/Exonuclease/phosphatase family.
VEDKKISLMTWNIKDCNSANMNIVIKHLENKNSIAILQEFPYRNEKEFLLNFKEYFQEDIYDCIYNAVNKANFVTVAIAKKRLNIKDDEGLITKTDINANVDYACRYVSFKIDKKGFEGLKILGVHVPAKDQSDLRKKLSEKPNYHPNIILGDFNAGNYIKNDPQKDAEFSPHRIEYLLLTEGYIDLVQGQYTFKYKTHIDHVLLENSNEFISKYKYSNVYVDQELELSDHYPITFELILR